LLLRQQNLQKYLDSLQEWALLVWQMLFNYKKCKIMHFGSKNMRYSYYMKEYQKDEIIIHQLDKTTLERDLGVLISDNLKWECQINKSVSTATFVMRQIKNSFKNLDVNIVRLLYTSLIRPHLEFSVSVWNPYLKKDTDKLEKIQRRATKLVPNLHKKSYEYRLKVFNLTNLSIRRQRGDLIQYFKTINKLDNINWIKEPRQIIKNAEKGPSFNLRRDEFQLYKDTKLSNCRDKFFLNRVIPLWNDLPLHVKEIKTLNGFKAGIDKLEKFST
jgi:hypothetical protein